MPVWGYVTNVSQNRHIHATVWIGDELHGEWEGPRLLLLAWEEAKAGYLCSLQQQQRVLANPLYNDVWWFISGSISYSLPAILSGIKHPLMNLLVHKLDRIETMSYLETMQIRNYVLFRNIISYACIYSEIYFSCTHGKSLKNICWW